MITPDWEKETDVPLKTSCKQAARLVSISFERKLTLREWVSMKLHLLGCRTCSFYRRQIKALRAIFARHEDVLLNTPPSDNERLDPKAKARLNDAIKKKLP